jgi:hypothetical protein
VDGEEEQEAGPGGCEACDAGDDEGADLCVCVCEHLSGYLRSSEARLTSIPIREMIVSCDESF